MWRLRGRRKTYSAATLLAVAVLAVAVWLALPVLVERRVVEELRAAGIEVASLNVTSVGPYEARITDVRLGVDGGFSAGEVIAAYDLSLILGGPIKRVVLRDVLVQGRLDSDGLLFGQLGPTAERGGPLLPASFVAAMPPVEIESGRIELATPIGPAVLPIRGLLTPKPDGSVEAALDVQVESEWGAIDGALALVAQQRRIDAELTIDTGLITGGADIPIAFDGNVKLGWEQGGHPQIAAALELLAASVAATDFPAVKLIVDMTDARWRGQTTVAEGDGVSDLEATVIVDDPYGEPRLSATGKVNATSSAWIWPVVGLPRPQEGSAQIEFRLQGPLPDGALVNQPIRTASELIGVLADGNVSGGAEFTVSKLVFPGAIDIESATGHADINAADGTVSIAALSGLQVTATFAPEFLGRLGLPAELEAPLMGRSTGSLALPQPLRLVAGEGTTDASGRFQFKLGSAAGATLDVQASGTAVLADDLTVNRFAVDDGMAVLDGLVLPAGGGRVEIKGAVAGMPQKFEGRLKLAGHLSDLRIGGYQADSIDLDVDPSIDWADGRLALTLLTDGTATARQVAGGVLAGKLAELTVPLLMGEAPLLAIDLNDAAAPNVAFDLRLGAIKATVPLLAGGSKPLRVALAVPALQWAGTWSAAAGHAGALHLNDGSLSLPSLDMAATGVRADVTIAANKASADLAVARITSVAKPALHVPLSLTGKAEASDGRLTFTGVLRDRSKRFNSTIGIEHTFAADTGQATLKMAPVTFEAGGLQPQDLVPAIASQVEEVTGESALAGTIRWSSGKLVSDLELLLKDLSFKSPQADILKLNGVVKIDSLVPFTTKPGQQLAAGLVDVGLPLSDLIAEFHIAKGNRLVIESARLALTGGEVSLPAVEFDLADPRAELTLMVKDVDLAKLLQLAQVEGLAGTGNLTGRIPVSIAGSSVTIHDAALAATGPGTLRYVPTQSAAGLLGGGESVDLALRALSNFEYKDLTLTLSREAGGDTVALLHVIGENPDFYGGHPVELNLNISGKLDEILDRGLAGYRIPETIRKRLGEFED